MRKRNLLVFNTVLLVIILLFGCENNAKPNNLAVDADSKEQSIVDEILQETWNTTHLSNNKNISIVINDEVITSKGKLLSGYCIIKNNSAAIDLLMYDDTEIFLLKYSGPFIEGESISINLNGKQLNVKAKLPAIEGETGNDTKTIIKDNLIYKLDNQTQCASVIGMTENAKLDPSITKVEILSYCDGYSVFAIDSNAFDNCIYIEQVSIPEGVKNIGDYAFRNCKKLKLITLPQSISSVGVGILANCTDLFFVSLPDSLNKIEDDMFDNCVSLSNIIFPSVVEEIGDNAFRNCENLIQCEFPSLKKLGNSAFRNCKNMNSINIGETYIIGNYCFMGCRKLEKVLFSFTDIEMVISRIGDYAFANCELLEDFAIETQTTLRSKTVSGSVGAGAFFGCKKIRSQIDLYSMEEVGDYCFASSGFTISFGQFLNYSVSCNIGKHAFEGCKISGDSFYDVDLTNVKKVGDYAFSGCIFYDTGFLLFGDNLIEVGAHAFTNFHNLERIEIDQPENSLDLSNAGIPSSCDVVWNGQ